MSDEVPITELEKIEADRVDGVGTPANGIPFLMMKSTGVAKDWAAWDAAHEAGGSGSNAGAASAQSQARQTQAQEKDGKGKPTAAQLHNAHEVHEAHEEHLHAEHETHIGHTEHETAEEHAAAVRAERGQTHPASSTSTATASAEQEAKDKQLSAKSATGRNCPGCSKTFDADHKGNTCPNCGADLPAADDAAKMAATLELVKAIVGRKVDETPDIAGGTAVIAQIADLIIAEAQELKAGNTGEISDIQQLAMAAEMIWAWRTGEESVAAGSVMPATALMQSAAKSGPSQAERDKAASEGNALPDGSYPIRNTDELASAAILARSGHGDVTSAKKLIGRRAKELGVANPLDDDDTAKSVASEVAEDATAVNTEPQGYEGVSKETLDAAVTKAMAPLQERIKSLDAELAKVKATPIPGGPLLRATAQSSKTADGEDRAAKAAYYRAQADAVSDPGTADGYRQLARQVLEGANATA